MGNILEETSVAVQLDLDRPDLAQAIEQLSEEEINTLPFGVVRLDAAGAVVFYSAYERWQTGLRTEAISRSFFAEIAPCLDTPRFRGRIEQALAQGRLDIAFDYTADLPSGAQDVDQHMRIVSASAGGCWIAHRLDD